MKKRLIKITIIAFALLLQGCMNVTVEYGIDERHTVHLEYRIEIDVYNMDDSLVSDVIALLSEIEGHYNDMGFATRTNIRNEHQIILVLRLEERTNSYEEAYVKLKELLTNPQISFLTAVDLTSEVTQYEIGFSINLEADVNRIIEFSGLNEIQPTLRNQLSEGLEESEIILVLRKPHTNIVRTSDNVSFENINNMTIFTAPLNIDQETTIEIAGRISLENNRALNMTIEESIERTENQIQMSQILIFVGIIGAIAVLGGTLLYLKKAKKEIKTEEVD